MTEQEKPPVPAPCDRCGTYWTYGLECDRCRAGAKLAERKERRMAELRARRELTALADRVGVLR